MGQSEQGDQKEPTPYDMEDTLQPENHSEARFMGIRNHHVIRSPGEIISFAKLLLRWRHNSFYVLSYCAGLKGPQPDSSTFDYDMRLRIAKRIAVRMNPLDTVKASGNDAPLKNHDLIITLATCKQDRTLRTFHLFCNLFNLLYFDIKDVEAMERRFPEILMTDPSIQNQDPLFTTTRENLNRVAPLALYYWHCINGNLGEAVVYIDYTQQIEDFFAQLKGALPKYKAWSLNEGIHYPKYQFKKFMELSEEQVSPTLPFEMPVKFKRSRKNEIEEYRPLIKQLEDMGIDDARNRAKIIYSLFPQLSHGEIGRLFPASPDTKTSKQTDRDRGRWLLGLH